ncbi:MAG: Fic family protein [Bacteroidales bacterium]|nr:Fic family protein [Bacteroidales bacterium]
MNESVYTIPTLPLTHHLETLEVMRQLNKANRKLAELRGVAQTIPNEALLINTLTLQEAKDSSEVENIITTQDELFKAQLNLRPNALMAAEKEVMNYRQALLTGFDEVRKKRILSLNTIKSIQLQLEHNSAGFRKVPGTTLKRSDGTTVYTPPQTYEEIIRHMNNLETFINDESLCPLDPLIKMAIIHHQFESIHPFYDGNGRCGRIVLILYLVTADLLDLPILYLSRYITHHKGEYYNLLQAVRNKGTDNGEEWIRWILFMLRGVEQTATETIELVKGISKLMAAYKQQLRPAFGKLYRHELLNNLFFHPYTKIEFIECDMMVQRKTASRYLDKIVAMGLLEKVKLGTSNYYVNAPLVALLSRVNVPENGKTGT